MHYCMADGLREGLACAGLGILFVIFAGAGSQGISSGFASDFLKILFWVGVLAIIVGALVVLISIWDYGGGNSGGNR